MPHIHTQVNLPISHEQETAMKSAMGRAIGAIRGKTEAYLMLSFEENARLWLGGEDSPCAMLEVSLLGGASHEECDRLTGLLSRIIEETLGVAQSRIYVRYSMTEEWGWNGTQL